MSFTDLMHVFSRILRFRQTATKVQRASAPPPPLDFDPFWHGDHWQNLLASPMDARHYVMEDWAMPVSEEFDASYRARLNGLKDGRASRRRN
jgi:hypothetical protein